MVRDTSDKGSTNQQAKLDKNRPKDFKGAAVINADGSETPITEAMVQGACEKLEEVRPGSASSSSTGTGVDKAKSN